MVGCSHGLAGQLEIVLCGRQASCQRPPHNSCLCAPQQGVGGRKEVDWGGRWHGVARIIFMVGHAGMLLQSIFESHIHSGAFSNSSVAPLKPFYDQFSLLWGVSIIINQPRLESLVGPRPYRS